MDFKQKCIKHQGEDVNNLCVNQNCRLQERVACSLCASEHGGELVQIDEIIGKIDIVKSNYLKICENFAGYETKILNSISDQIHYARNQMNFQFSKLQMDISNKLKGGYFRKMVDKIIETTQNTCDITYWQIVSNQELQIQLIERQLEKNYKFSQIEDEIQCLNSQSSQYLINLDQFFQQTQFLISQILQSPPQLEIFPGYLNEAPAQPTVNFNSDNNNTEEEKPIEQIQDENQNSTQMIELKQIWKINDIKSDGAAHIHMIQMSKGNSILITNNNNDLCFVNYLTGKLQQIFKGATDLSLYYSLFTIQQRFIGMKCCDGKVYLFNESDSKLHQEFDLREKVIDNFNNSICFLPNHQLLFASFKYGQDQYGMKLYYRDLKDEKFYLHSQQIEGYHDDSIYIILQIDDNLVISASHDGLIQFWDVKNYVSGNMVQETSAICCIQKLGESQIIYNMYCGSIVIFDLLKKEKVKVIKTEPNTDVSSGKPKFYTFELLNDQQIILCQQFRQRGIQVLDLETEKTNEADIDLKNIVSAILIEKEEKQLLCVFSESGLYQFEIL